MFERGESRKRRKKRSMFRKKRRTRLEKCLKEKEVEKEERKEGC